MKLIDAHTHMNWDELYPQRQEYLSQFIQVGGKWLINSWASDQYNERGIKIAQQAETLLNDDIIIKATIWYHPGECWMEEPTTVCTEVITEENIESKINILRTLYNANKEYIVAIGECGIDTFFPGSENHLSIQKKLFAFQCDLAKELKLPLMVHIRKDFDSWLDVLKNYRDMTIHFHCRSFGPEEVERVMIESKRLWWNLFIWFCGNITYKNAQNLRDSLNKVPLNQLFLETDAPWLSPQVIRGETNHPANVKYIYEYVSEFLWISLEELSEQVYTNFCNLYKQ